MKIPGGFFITLEGIEGCGKTTQSKSLYNYLIEMGYEVVNTREPGGTSIGSRIRDILLDSRNESMASLTELLLFFADRAQHISEVIKPALSDGKVVVCDRFIDATIAYQGFARGLDMNTIISLSNVSTQGLSPELTLLFDLPVETGLDRALGRSKTAGQEKKDKLEALDLFSHSELSRTEKEVRFEQEALEFHERVRRGYLDIASQEPDRVKVIDASGTVDEVWASVLSVVTEALAEAGK